MEILRVNDSNGADVVQTVALFGAVSGCGNTKEENKCIFNRSSLTFGVGVGRGYSWEMVMK